MNKDILSGIWLQAKGKCKEFWGQLTDDDIEQIDGKFDVLVGKVQERYGWTREQALAECNAKFDKLAAQTPKP